MSGRSAEPDPGRGLGAVATLALILLLTAAWWALALWPVGGAPPEWLLRARAACFGSTGSGLPDTAGWVALILQPALMVGTLLVGWGREVRRGLRVLLGSPPGRVAAWGTAAALVVGLGAAAYRIASAAGAGLDALHPRVPPAEGLPPETYPRLDRPAPALGLVDQAGRRVELEEFRGRPVLVTFAYGHCETVCPVVVHEALRAQALLAPARPALLVVTLDPWRDTPARLPHIAERWGLGPDGRVLGGSVEEVKAVLDAWGIARSRDPRTGEIVHPIVVYVVDGSGRIAYAAPGRAESIAELARRL